MSEVDTRAPAAPPAVPPAGEGPAPSARQARVLPEGPGDGAGAGLSPAKLALRQAMLRGAVRAAPAGIPRRAAGGDAPLSFAQERLWFLERLQPGLAAYNLPASRRFSGPLDAGALERAMGEIVRRHESLRTTFREVDGVPVQVVSPFGGFALPVDDLSALGEAAREAEVRRREAEQVERPFDLTVGPLYRAALLRLGEREHALLFCLHHIVTDGWSMDVFFRELLVLYEAYRDGRDPGLPEPPIQYGDYAVWQREQWRAEEARHVAYWRERLAGAPELLELPADHPRPPVPSFRGASVPVEVPAEVLERLRELGRREGATLYMVVLAAFQLVLSRWSGSDDVLVGTLVAGRTREEVEPLVGLFMNTLVLRGDLSGDPTFRDLVAGARESVLGA
ncbi:MAG: condensation domain-containing protein, partial [Longimicrobiaceae bacterium]